MDTTGMNLSVKRTVRSRRLHSSFCPLYDEMDVYPYEAPACDDPAIVSCTKRNLSITGLDRTNG